MRKRIIVLSAQFALLFSVGVVGAVTTDTVERLTDQIAPDTGSENGPVLQSEIPDPSRSDNPSTRIGTGITLLR
jgi:hypothetical protein